MPAFIKSPADEALWERAKEQAAKQGQAGNWAYVTAIYKQMNGGKVAGLKDRLAYGKEFMKWVGDRMFRNPETRRQVKFRSLPENEQARIHRSWSRQQEHGGEEPHRQRMHDELLSWWKQHPNDRGPDQRLLDEGLIERDPRARERVYSPSEEGLEIIRQRQKKQASRVASRWLLGSRPQTT